MKIYTVYLKTGKAIVVRGESSHQTPTLLEIYENVDHTGLVARFYVKSIAGFMISNTEGGGNVQTSTD